MVEKRDVRALIESSIPAIAAGAVQIIGVGVEEGVPVALGLRAPVGDPVRMAMGEDQAIEHAFHREHGVRLHAFEWTDQPTTCAERALHPLRCAEATLREDGAVEVRLEHPSTHWASHVDALIRRASQVLARQIVVHGGFAPRRAPTAQPEKSTS